MKTVVSLESLEYLESNLLIRSMAPSISSSLKGTVKVQRMPNNSLGILTSPFFRDPKIRGTLVKSPAELTVGTIRALNIPIKETRFLVNTCRFLGQDLLDPPQCQGMARWNGLDRFNHLDDETAITQPYIPGESNVSQK